MLAENEREYNRIIQQRHRQREKEIQKLYQDKEVTGISFTEFKKQIKLSKWERLSMILSDEELKIGKLSYKLSDEQIRKIINKLGDEPKENAFKSKKKDEINGV